MWNDKEMRESFRNFIPNDKSVLFFTLSTITVGPLFMAL
jgi:hypothetical protein